MNIKKAKEQIKNAMTAYFSKDRFGEYEIPIEKQRPVFLMGPPGIGKTAIMEQIAAELDVCLLSYSMTHHTRQSALGLPFIVKKSFGGTEYDISEYTMSEIIASVYDLMENTGKKEGILFLDEINCVSETLAPSMLQFLQYKTFGKHKVPEGWIVVTAGNPPEYNNSVREFDIVTWDRLKRIDVEPDYVTWKEYAANSGVHASILTYLDIKKDDFYRIESTVGGKSFVTARGWSDLSAMIKLYEKNGIRVDEELIGQYLQDKRIAKSFAVYYDLFNKYKSDYQIDRILLGKETEEIRQRAREAKFDERLALLGLLIDAITSDLKEVCYYEEHLTALLSSLKRIRTDLSRPSADCDKVVRKETERLLSDLERDKAAGSLSENKKYAIKSTVEALNEMNATALKISTENTDSFTLFKKDYDGRVKMLKSKVGEASGKLEKLFEFSENVFDDGQEMLILVTELTISYYGAHFISRYGCEKYFQHNKELLFYERQKELIQELEKLDIELL